MVHHLSYITDLLLAGPRLGLYDIIIWGQRAKEGLEHLFDWYDVHLLVDVVEKVFLREQLLVIWLFELVNLELICDLIIIFCIAFSLKLLILFCFRRQFYIFLQCFYEIAFGECKELCLLELTEMPVFNLWLEDRLILLQLFGYSWSIDPLTFSHFWNSHLILTRLALSLFLVFNLHLGFARDLCVFLCLVLSHLVRGLFQNIEWFGCLFVAARVLA